MNPISEQDVSALADAVRRRHRACGADLATLAALETHMYRVATFVDDLSEAESLNALDYQLLRVAATLHDAARAKARPESSAAASAVIAGDMLRAIGADPEFADAVAATIRRHAADDADEAPETHIDRLLHDACLLARMVEADEDDVPGGVQTLAGRRLAARIADDLRAGKATAPIG